MGLKVNFFVLAVALYAIPYKNSSCLLFVTCTTVFIFLHQYWKIWKFIERFPGGRTFPLAKRFLENSSRGFCEELNRTWRQYGCDKFVTWIGFERFVTVSKWCDVKVKKSEIFRLPEWKGNNKKKYTTTVQVDKFIYDFLSLSLSLAL